MNDVRRSGNNDRTIGLLRDGSFLQQVFENRGGLAVGLSSFLSFLQAFLQLGDLLFTLSRHDFLEVIFLQLVLQLSLRPTSLRSCFQQVSCIAVHRYEVTRDTKVSQTK